MLSQFETYMPVPVRECIETFNILLQMKFASHLTDKRFKLSLKFTINSLNDK